MTDDTRTEATPATVKTETTVTPQDWSPWQWGDKRQAVASVLPAAQPDAATREITMVLSDESVDSYGTSFEVRGWRDLRPGGVPLLLSHDRDRLPVGRIERLDKTALGTRKVLLAHARFAPEGASPAADEAYKLARAGVLKDVSVGFHPHGIRRPDKAERERMGMPDHGVIFTDTELLEGSLVAVPANKGANVLTVRAMDADSFKDALDRNASLRAAIQEAAKGISGGNEPDPSLRELMMLQLERLESLERAVQALGTRDIGGSGGPSVGTSPKPLPQGCDDPYRELLDAVKASLPRSPDVRDPGSPGAQRPGGPAR